MTTVSEDVSRIIQSIKEYKSQQPSVLITSITKNLSQLSFESLLDTLADSYYNDTPITTDETFDILQHIYEVKFKKYNKVGAPPRREAKKVLLPEYMGSLSKVTEENQLSIWLKKWKSPSTSPSPINIISMEKLDGVSALYVKKGETINLYKHGHGTTGSDITHLLKHISIPTIKETNCIVRGELMVKNKTYTDKYSNVFKNTRGMVTGLTNPLTKVPDADKLKDVDFVAYKLSENIEQSSQLNKLEKMGFMIPKWDTVSIEDVNMDMLKILLQKTRNKSAYNLDGLVLAIDQYVQFPQDSDPKHIVAYKTQGQVVVVEVKRVEWNISKHGLYKPKVYFNKVDCGGAQIECATGHNARFVIDNGIATGSKITISRSGDTIPKIEGVVVRVDVFDKGDMPPEGTFEWKMNKKGEKIELMMKNIDNKNVGDTTDEEEDKEYDEDNNRSNQQVHKMNIKKIYSFFKTLDAKQLGEKTISKLYDSGYNTLKKLFNARVDDMIEFKGFQEAGASKLVQNIKTAITTSPLYSIMAASGCFGSGIGQKKLKKIVDKHPDILQLIDNGMSDDELETLIKGVGGFNETAGQFVNGVVAFMQFLKDHEEIKLNLNIDGNVKMNSYVDETDTDKVDTANIFKGKTFVYTGFTNKDWDKIIERFGGTRADNITKNTSILVIKDRSKDNPSVKEKRAIKDGICILSKDEFEKDYINSDFSSGKPDRH